MYFVQLCGTLIDLGNLSLVNYCHLCGLYAAMLIAWGGSDLFSIGVFCSARGIAQDYQREEALINLYIGIHLKIHLFQIWTSMDNLLVVHKIFKSPGPNKTH
jgi:hypothetical protein